jgi:short-subunit dehydrogenase
MAFRSALITGASSGIGAAFARGLPRSTTLLLAGRDRDQLSRLAHELASPERLVRIVAADLSIDAERGGVIAAAESAAVDLVINNAGLGRLGRGSAASSRIRRSERPKWSPSTRSRRWRSAAPSSPVSCAGRKPRSRAAA